MSGIRDINCCISRLTTAALPARSTLLPPSQDHIPNPNRPANPFSPASQPDWIVRPNEGNGSLSSDAIAGHDSALSRLKLSEGQEAPPRLPARSVSASSTASAMSDGSDATVIRKSSVPPMVPRKPVGLSGTGPVAQSPISSSAAPMPPPRRSATNQSITRKSLLDGDDEATSAPPLPRRQQTDIDAMGDDGADDSLSSWAPLKPS